ncbi:MAG: hypothetical protein ABI321_16775 [Polyangia bacterium]
MRIALAGSLAVLSACGGDGGNTGKDASANVTDMESVTDDLSMASPGAGATLACQSSGKNAYLTYGATAFNKVNDSIFARVLADATASLGDSFNKVGSGVPASTADPLESFKGSLLAFLVHAYGGPSYLQYTDGVTYYGVRDMAVAHAGLGITQAQYSYFVTSIIVPSLIENGVLAGSGDGADDISSCFAPVLTDQAFVDSIVGK